MNAMLLKQNKFKILIGVILSLMGFLVLPVNTFAVTSFPKVIPSERIPKPAPAVYFNLADGQWAAMFGWDIVYLCPTQPVRFYNLEVQYEGTRRVSEHWLCEKDKNLVLKNSDAQWCFETKNFPGGTFESSVTVKELATKVEEKCPEDTGQVLAGYKGGLMQVSFCQTDKRFIQWVRYIKRPFLNTGAYLNLFTDSNNLVFRYWDPKAGQGGLWK